MRWGMPITSRAHPVGPFDVWAPPAPSKEEIVRAYAVLFWFNLYLRLPEFPASDGMFPQDVAVRRAFLEVHTKVFLHWVTAANRLGIASQAFRDACEAVRASWIGPGDPLRTCRCRASMLSDWPRLDLD